MKKLRKEVDECLNGVNGDFIGMMDILYCTAFNITIDEIEKISELLSDDELNILVSGLDTLNKKSTFTEKRNALELRNKYVEYYKSK